jgi:predicted HTH domain antitoxin
MNIVIPDDVIRTAKISEAELKLEIAILLFQQKKISTGKARQLAGLNLIEFRQELAKRNICVHYDLEDLQADLKTLQEAGEL